MTGVAPDGPETEREWPTVSVVIPCRNEATCIDACLDSILGGEYPASRLEVLIADGMSDDGTRASVESHLERDPRLRLIDNPERIASAGLNAAIRQATGEVIVRMDAHAVYPPDYLRCLVAALEETGAENVGAVVTTVPADDTLLARAIAAGLSHPLGVGNSQFRIGVTTRRWVDHVPFGCWRRAVLERLGPFDEELVRGQDVEMNARILAAGGRILLIPETASVYFGRRTLGQVGRMLYQYGYFKPLVARKIGKLLTLRQLVPPLFVVGVGSALVLGAVTGLLWPLGAILGPYAAVVAGGSAASARRHGGAAAAILVVLPVMHLGYGLGYLRGCVDHLVLGRRSAKPAATVALTR